MYLVKWDIFFNAVGSNDARSLRSKAEQHFDRAAGLAPRAQFQHLPEQTQGRDHGRGFKLDRRFGAMPAERRREDVGKERGDDAVNPRRPRSNRDQREHIRTAVHD